MGRLSLSAVSHQRFLLLEGKREEDRWSGKKPSGRCERGACICMYVR